MEDSNGVVDSNACFPSVLDLAADNDVRRFEMAILGNPKALDEVGSWYGRRVGTRTMVLEDRTLLMVAAEYGSVEVIEAILSLSERVDLDRSSGLDKCTALHFAVSGGSSRVADVVKVMLLAGADPGLSDAKGRRPLDVVNVSRLLPEHEFVLKDLLCCENTSSGSDLAEFVDGLGMDMRCNSAPCEELLIASANQSSSVMDSKFVDAFVSSSGDKKEYPIDPSIPDINNGSFATDEFRMYSFKVRPCSRAYSHDWTECPFVHPGENARRRDPRKFHYSCVPCQEFRKGSCRRGDLCEYAHGIFECWLHPAQYRTRLCKDRRSCARRVCFFAHTLEELRSLFVSSRSALSSPRSSVSTAVSPSSYTPPMSPSGNGISPSSPSWPRQNIPLPNLLLPGSRIQAHNTQTSRLRSSLKVRNVQTEELYMLQESELEQQQIIYDMSIFSQPYFKPQFAEHRQRLVPSDHFQRQQMTSPISSEALLAKSIGHLGLQPPVTSPSSGIMLPRDFESKCTALSTGKGMYSLHKKKLQLQGISSCDRRACITRDIALDACPAEGSPVIPWSSKWDSFSNGKPDLSLKGNDFGPRSRRSYLGRHHTEEPDITWVHSLVNDSPLETGYFYTGANQLVEGSCSNNQSETFDQPDVVTWVDQLHPDQIAA